MTVPLRVVAWETTRRCHLACRHCRGVARDEHYEGELTTQEGKGLIDGIASFANPVLILTGGEPMARNDIYDLARYASDRGLHTVMAPCGHLITAGTARRLKESGIGHISISIDGATEEAHDSFRGVPGAFKGSLQGIFFAREAGISFQINITVSRLNVIHLPAIVSLAQKLGASAVDFFFLVPTGRGSGLQGLALSPQEYEQTLNWIADVSENSPIPIRTTCAPHYSRIMLQRKNGMDTASGHHYSKPRACMGGRGFVFVSHRGIVQACGFLDIPCGNVREENFNLEGIYNNSPVFLKLRDIDSYHGKCGICEYRKVCGGCRARAYADTGDYTGSEPSCSYQPALKEKSIVE
ncbi:MAG: radical SAM protein [Candidatus Auribacterota bacterium]